MGCSVPAAAFGRQISCCRFGRLAGPADRFLGRKGTTTSESLGIPVLFGDGMVARARLVRARVRADTSVEVGERVSQVCSASAC